MLPPLLLGYRWLESVPAVPVCAAVPDPVLWGQPFGLDVPVQLVSFQDDFLAVARPAAHDRSDLHTRPVPSLLLVAAVITKLDGLGRPVNPPLPARPPPGLRLSSRTAPPAREPT